MERMLVHPQVSGLEVPGIVRVKTAAPLHWLAAGWRDLSHTPLHSLGYGLVFAWLGYFLIVWAWQHVPLAMSLSSGFLLVAPFLAIGFYDLSRQMEDTAGRPSLRHSLAAWRENGGSIGFYALLLAFMLSCWERLSAILVGLLVDPETIASVQNFTSEILSGRHDAFLLAYGACGALLALLVFSLSVVSLPMLLDRKVDLATALATSLLVVRENALPMLVWAALIVALIGLGFATYMVGLVVAFPLVGHATWHAYRELVERE